MLYIYISLHIQMCVVTSRYEDICTYPRLIYIHTAHTYVYIHIFISIHIYTHLYIHIYIHIFISIHRPTQSIMYVPLQVNRFRKSVLLIVQYKYLKSCSGDFYSPESDPPHKIMRYWLYYSICWFFHFHLTESVRWK